MEESLYFGLGNSPSSGFLVWLIIDEGVWDGGAKVGRAKPD